jgi:hypothetical protein
VRSGLMLEMVFGVMFEAMAMKMDKGKTTKGDE